MFSKKKSFLVLSTIGLLCIHEHNVWATTTTPKSDDSIVCVVGNRTIKHSDIDKILQQISQRKKGKVISQEEKSRFKEDYITMCQLVEWAKMLKLWNSAIDQAFFSAALAEVEKRSGEVTKKEVDEEVIKLKDAPDTKTSLVFETVIVDRTEKNMDEELVKLKSLKSDLSSKEFENWAKKHQVKDAGGEYKVNDFTVKMLNSTPQLAQLIKSMKVGDIQVVPLSKEDRYILIVRFTKEGVPTSDTKLSSIAVQNIKNKKIQSMIQKIKEEFPAVKAK